MRRHLLSAPALRSSAWVTRHRRSSSLPKGKKVYESAAAAVADIPDGATLLCGGFGLTGVPENLLEALRQGLFAGRSPPLEAPRSLHLLASANLRLGALVLMVL